MTSSRPQRPRRRRGFTLLEIMVVVTIIALLAALVAPRIFGQVGTARASAAKAQASTISEAVNLYVLDSGLSSPGSDFELDDLMLRADEGGGSNGPYLEKADDLVDPWGNRYEIIVPGEINASFDIVSYGEDGQPGGEGAAADITQ